MYCPICTQEMERYGNMWQHKDSKRFKCPITNIPVGKALQVQEKKPVRRTYHRKTGISRRPR